MKQPTLESFLEDVKNHKMTILHDDGIYRHIKFSRNNSSCYRFDLVTYPGYLVISGDMGEYVFSRTNDMFNFFSSGIKDDGTISINPSYWSEKCQAQDKHNLIEKFDYDTFEKNVKDYWESWFEDNLESEEAKEVWDQIENYVLTNETVEWFNVSAIYEFDTSGINTDFSFIDFFEYNCDAYDYCYIWCLYAIVWGIKQYKENKE